MTISVTTATREHLTEIQLCIYHQIKRIKIKQYNCFSYSIVFFLIPSFSTVTTDTTVYMLLRCLSPASSPQNLPN